MKSKLYKEIEKLIQTEGIETFLFGSKSQFNDLCHKIVSDLKCKYPHIQRIYVRAEAEHIEGEGSRAYREKLAQHYEKTYYPVCVSGAGKAVYVKRNCHMIDESAVCIIYYDEKYKPAKRRQSNRDLLEYQPASGTEVACRYAEKKNNQFV